MFKKDYLLFCLLLLFVSSSVKAQSDTLPDPGVPEEQVLPERRIVRDSAFLVAWNNRRDSLKRFDDSLEAIGDSLSMVWLTPRDLTLSHRFRDSLIEVYSVRNLDFHAWASKFPKKVERYDRGRPRPKGEMWIMVFVVVLLLSFALLKNAFSKEMSAIIQAFYSDRALAQIIKEEKFFNSWPFIFLYLLFGFTIGMFLFQCGKYFQISYGYSGFSLFIYLSVIVLILYTAKVILVRVLGFLFDVIKISREYVSILILSYFNAALLFIPIVIAFCLTPARYAPIYIYLSLILVAGIFIFQFLRSVTNILSGYRFRKIYLIFYLCALEICPLLILIKALRF